MLETPLLAHQPYADLLGILATGYMNSTQFHVDDDSDSESESGDAVPGGDQSGTGAPSDDEADEPQSPEELPPSVQVPPQTLPTNNTSLPKPAQTEIKGEAPASRPPVPERKPTMKPALDEICLADGVYYIYNSKHDNGAICPTGDYHQQVVGTFMDTTVEGADPVKGRKWKVTRYKKTRKYFIHNSDFKIYAGHDYNPRSTEPGSVIAKLDPSQWVIDFIAERDGQRHYTIKHIEDDRFWGLTNASDQTGVMLRQGEGDKQNHWTFEVAAD